MDFFRYVIWFSWLLYSAVFKWIDWKITWWNPLILKRIAIFSSLSVEEYLCYLLSIYLSNLSIYLSVIYRSIYLSICYLLSIYLSICYLPMYLSMYKFSRPIHNSYKVQPLETVNRLSQVFIAFINH